MINLTAAEKVRQEIGILEKQIIRAADNGYVGQSKDELQLNVLCQIALALVAIAEAIEHKAKEKTL